MRSCCRIADAGEKILCLLCGGSIDDSVNELRYNIFCQKASTSKTAITPESLPPTIDAAFYHTCRAYHRVQVWIGIEDIDPLKWGWKVRGNTMMPISTQKPPAPPELLKMFRCGCRTGCKNSQCSCVKYGLKCSQVCSDCRGVSCCNSRNQYGVR